MSDLPAKPLPVVTDLKRPFWRGAREGRLMIQKCPRCGTVNFHPKPWCIECGCRELEWKQMKPTGTIYSFTVSRSVAMNYRGWQDELPVVLCLVDIDEGARMYAQLKEVRSEDVQVGMRVQALFEPICEEYGIPVFRPFQADGLSPSALNSA